MKRPKFMLPALLAVLWTMSWTGVASAGPIHVEGYTNALSFAPGDEVAFHVSTDAPSYSITIARSGVAESVVWEKGDIPGQAFPVPERAWETGPGWPVSETVIIPADWRSGFYRVTFRSATVDGRSSQSEHFFVLRSGDPGQDTKTLLVIPTATYNAYNNWGGANLYDGGHKVSLLRPIMRGLLSKPEIEDARIADLDQPNRGFMPDYATYMEKHDFPLWVSAAGWASYDQIFVQWAEGEGRVFDYATSEDLIQRPELLDNYTLMVSVGHDEYWSWDMRDAVEARVEAGMNLAWFVGNSVYWQTRYTDDGTAMISYKTEADALDPVRGTDKEHLLTTVWSDRRIGRPENTILGLSFNAAGYTRIAGATPQSSGGYQIYRPDHWVFTETALRWGDQLGVKDRIVAYEVDGLRYTIDGDGYPVPTGEDGTPRDATILAMAPASLWNLEDTPEGAMAEIPDAEVAALAIGGDRSGWRRYKRGMAAMVIFTRGKGTVFNAGTTDWIWGLRGGDTQVEQITRNVLNRLAE